jgi:transcriptional regulator with XRE-family HTH domain
MTQRELARQAGLSAAAIRDLEQGRTKSPRPDSLQVIAAALALSTSDAENLYDTATVPPSRPIDASTRTRPG